MDAIVIGTNGQLSDSLAERRPDLDCWGLDRIDLTRPKEAEDAIAASGAKLVINAAAYTAVDKAEEQRDLAHAVNATGAGAVARGATRAGAAMVHVSTDYVFNGSKDGEWVEDDAVDPLGVYGATKLEGELSVAAACPRHVTLRTAWVYSPFGHNFVKTMLGLADRERLTIVADQLGKPTAAGDLADAIFAIAPRLAQAPEGDPVWGVYHYSGAGVTHWAGFAEEIYRLAKGRLVERAPEVAHITTAEYPTPAARPANSALDCSKFERVFGVKTVPWRELLARVVDRLEADAKGGER